MKELCYVNNSKSLFKKYRYLITYLTKHQLFRDYIGLPHQVDLLLPNGYHKILDKKHIEATFYTRAVYALKLYPVLQELDLNAIYLKDFRDAERFLLGKLGLIRAKEYLPLFLRLPYFTTTDFVPDANVESTSVDGMIERAGVDEAWATIRAGAGTTAYPSIAGTTSPDLLASGTSSQWARIRRNFYLYDTSSIGAGATVTVGQCTHKIYVTAKADQFSQSIRIVTSTPASNIDLTTGDFGSVGTVDQGTQTTITSMTTSAYNTQTLNTTGEGNIAVAGITKFGMRTSADASDTAPSWQSNVEASIDANFADTGSNKPTLTVVYTLLPSSGFFAIL